MGGAVIAIRARLMTRIALPMKGTLYPRRATTPGYGRLTPPRSTHEGHTIPSGDWNIPHSAASLRVPLSQIGGCSLGGGWRAIASRGEGRPPVWDNSRIRRWCRWAWECRWTEVPMKGILSRLKASPQSPPPGTGTPLNLSFSHRPLRLCVSEANVLYSSPYSRATSCSAWVRTTEPSISSLKIETLSTFRPSGRVRM